MQKNSTFGYIAFQVFWDPMEENGDYYITSRIVNVVMDSVFYYDYYNYYDLDLFEFHLLQLLFPLLFCIHHLNLAGHNLY